MKQLNDEKLSMLLEMLRTSHLDVYVNIKLNVTEIHKSLAVTMMEKAFMNRTCTAHDILLVSDKARDAIAQRFKLPCGKSTQSYLIAAVDHTYAALYHCNEGNQIVHRRHLFEKACVDDICNTFYGYFTCVNEFPFDKMTLPFGGEE